MAAKTENNWRFISQKARFTTLYKDRNAFYLRENGDLLSLYLSPTRPTLIFNKKDFLNILENDGHLKLSNKQSFSFKKETMTLLYYSNPYIEGIKINKSILEAMISWVKERIPCALNEPLAESFKELSAWISAHMFFKHLGQVALQDPSIESSKVRFQLLEVD